MVVNLFSVVSLPCSQVAQHGGIQAVKYGKKLKDVAKAVVPGLVESASIKAAAKEILAYYKA